MALLIPSDMATTPLLSPADLALMRRFEPVLCFNRGEQFYPMDAGCYLAVAGLCIKRPNEDPQDVVARGQLTADLLVERRPPAPGAVYYLSVADPLPAGKVRQFRHSSTLKDFHRGPGRLARVGLTARLGDLLFSLSLVLRGRAPKGLAASSAIRYQALQAQGTRYAYHGRVVREHGYIALQYWFFYAYNDWRSSFQGVNDHEADWEMITVYAAEDGQGAIQPVWLAYAAHNDAGDELRRRWDDPDLARVGEHPLVYVGAGSHASYYFPGEYLTTAILPYTASLIRLWQGVQRVWARLGQGNAPAAGAVPGLFRIPYVDYARGDGLRIGPGQERAWEICPLQAVADRPAPVWVDGYRGLWGRYIGDPFAGEDAPTGPRFQRDGQVRKAWYDPLGWSGLDKVSPPARALAVLEEQQQRLREEQQELTRQVADLADRQRRLEMESAAIHNQPALRAQTTHLERTIREGSAELDQLKARRETNELALASCAEYATQLAAGDPGDPRVHLHHPHLPTSPVDLRLSRLAQTWSAISIGVLLVAFVILAQFSQDLGPGLLVLLGIYAFMEALFRRSIRTLVSAVVVALALFSMLVLFITFLRPVALVALVVIGLVLIIENLREVWS
ncbi:MAG TPA: hypothetical protein VH599_17955 [Ktedonobacterales bacterium]|jgi:hypothetical protein